MSVTWRLSRLKPESEAKVGDAGSQVGLKQDVLTLEVPEKHTELSGRCVCTHLCVCVCVPVRSYLCAMAGLYAGMSSCR